jgi:methylmalonyl-CoA mutase C-terminal domain/subunit
MRKIKVYIGTLGLDQHELGAVAVSRMLRDAGMEVVYAGRFNLPDGILKTSLEEDVDVIGLSCHSWEHLYYVPELVGLLKEKGVEIPVVVGGSVITPGDRKRLVELGVAAAFGPGVSEQEIVEKIRGIAAGGDASA